jgi:hypothetical protein
VSDSRKARTRAIVLALLLAGGAVASPSTMAAPAHSHVHAGAPTHCPKSSLPVVRPRGCIPTRTVLGALGRGLGLSARAGRIMQTALYPRDHLRLRGRDRRASAAIDASLLGFGERLIGADGHGPPYPRGRVSGGAARAAGASISQTISDGHGLEATGTGQVIEAPPGEVGQGIAMQIGAQLGKGGVAATVGQGVSFSGFAASCPDSAGEVAGSALANVHASISAAGAALHGLSGTLAINARAAFTGHVGADGKLIDYDLVYDATFSYDGPAPGLFGIGVVDRHSREEIHMVFDHLRPDVPIADADFERQFWGYHTSGFGLGGLLSGAYANAVATTASLVYLNKSSADDALKAAEHNWYDNHACVKASFTPASLQDVSPGSANPVAIAVSDVRDGQPVALPATLAATSSGSGQSVTPTHAETGSTPIQATLTVSDAPGVATNLVITGVSKRGRLEDVFTATAALHLMLDYTYSSTASYTYPYDDSAGLISDSGTYSENRDIQVSTQIPLTEQGGEHPGPTGPNEDTYTGTAPLTWQRHNWSTEDVETTNSGQNYPKFCTFDDKENVTTAFSGAAQAKALNLDVNGFTRAVTANLDLVLSGVHETWHQNDSVTSGMCGSVVTDTDRSQFIGERLAQQSNELNPGSVELSANSGWQPGTGNTIATLTVNQSYHPIGPNSTMGNAKVTETYQIVKQ